MQAKFVGLACDGAPTNLGVNSGVQARLRKEAAPRLITTHCAAHRENLVGEKMGADMLFKVLASLVQLVYNYFKSPKRYAGLLDSADFLEMTLRAVLNPGATRWFSIRECLSSLLHNMPAVLHRLSYMHKEEGCIAAWGMLQSLMDLQTHVSLYLFTCLLDEMGSLNKSLQDPELLLADVADLVSRTVRRLREAYDGDDGFVDPEDRVTGELNPWGDLFKFLDVGAYDEWVQSSASRMVIDEDGYLMYTVCDELALTFTYIAPTPASTVGAAPTRYAVASDIKELMAAMHPKFKDISLSSRNELIRRFPDTDLLTSLSMVHPSYWKRPLLQKHAAAHLKVLIAHFCGAAKFVGGLKAGELAVPLLDQDKLNSQFEDFVAQMTSLAPLASTLSALWCSFGDGPQAQRISEFVKLAKLYVTLPVASVENEKCFSTMKQLKTDTRNRLSPEHLNTCMAIFKSNTSSTTFDYDACYTLFLETVRRSLDV